MMCESQQFFIFVEEGSIMIIKILVKMFGQRPQYSRLTKTWGCNPDVDHMQSDVRKRHQEVPLLRLMDSEANTQLPNGTADVLWLVRSPAARTSYTSVAVDVVLLGEKIRCE